MSAWPSGLTPRIALATFPSAPMTKVERLIPIDFFPYVFFSTQDGVEVGDLVLGVGEEREREAVLLLELAVRSLRVGADAENRRAALLKLAVDVPQAAGLLRTARRVVAGVEIEDHRAASQGGKAHALAAVARELEVRRLLPLLDHGREL